MKIKLCYIMLAFRNTNSSVFSANRYVLLSYHTRPRYRCTVCSITQGEARVQCHVWFTLCSLSGRRCNQQGLGLSRLDHVEDHQVVPDIAQYRFKSVPCAPGLYQFAYVLLSTFPICIQDEELIKRNSTKSSVHFENLNQVLPISSLLQGPEPYLPKSILIRFVVCSC